MPVAAEPGANGFVMLQEYEHADSMAAMLLPVNERHHIEEMERMNQAIRDVETASHLHDTVKFLERQRSHHEEQEYHERAVTEDDLKPRVIKKKGGHVLKQSPRATQYHPKQKPTRFGRVHQPK